MVGSGGDSMRAIGMSVTALLLCAATARAGIKWEGDFDQARQRSLEEDKLLLVVFYADW
jgi:hypothetical protein